MKVGLHKLLEKFYASRSWNLNIFISSPSLLLISEDGLKENSKNISMYVLYVGGYIPLGLGWSPLIFFGLSKQNENHIIVCRQTWSPLWEWTIENVLKSSLGAKRQSHFREEC